MKTVRFISISIFLWTALYSYTASAQKSADIVKKEKAIKEYYEAYVKKDWHMLELILADGFTFTSPNGDDRINLKLYKERCWSNANNTKKFELEKVMVEKDDALVTYNGWTNDGKLFRNTERFKFDAGKIKEIECFFGTGISFPNSGK